MAQVLHSLLMELTALLCVIRFPEEYTSSIILYCHGLAIFHGMFDLFHLKASDYPWYVFLVFCHVILWYWAPKIALAVFLPLSLYHFGSEDAAVEMKSKKSFFKGLLVFSGILYSDFGPTYLKELTSIDIDQSFYAYFRYIMILAAYVYSFEAPPLVRIKTVLELIIFSQTNSFYAFSIYYLCSHCYYSTTSQWYLIKGKQEVVFVTFLLIASSWIFAISAFELSHFTVYLRYVSSLATPHIILSIIN